MLSKSNKRVCAILLSFVFILSCFVSNIGPVAAAAITVSDSKLTLSYEAGNGWNDGTASYQQLNCTLTNGTAGVVTDWEVSFQFQAGATMNQGWCGVYTMDSTGKLTIKPSDSNATLQKSGATTFGFIVKNTGSLSDDCAAIVTYKLNGQVVSNETAVSEEPIVTTTVQVSEEPIVTTTAQVSEEPIVTTTAQVSEEPIVTTTAQVSEEPIVTTTAQVSEEPIVTVPVSEEPIVTSESPSPSPSHSVTGDDWLYTDGSKIIDKDGNEVWMTGVNWFGYNTGTNCFDGIWSCDLNTALQGIADRGFNLLRIPISSELLNDWADGVYPKPCYNDYVNFYLAGMNSLEIFDYVIDKCDELGIKIMIDIHCVTNAAAHYAPLWYTADATEAYYLQSLDWVSDRYKYDDTIIAYDLKNEPHGKGQETSRAIWNDSDDASNWKRAAELAASTVLANNPNALIMVEGVEVYPKDLETNSDYHSTNANDYYGTWWGGNLRGVKDYPIDLGDYQNKLVYSPHDYGPTVSAQSWFEGDYTFESLYNDVWEDNWMYIQEENIAPLLIGEWGGFMTEPNIKWMTYLRKLIIDNRINHTFWCYNANSGDTGGLVGYDFITWDEEKYEFVKEALWQENGKFVSLSHDTKLGANGTCLGEVFS